MHFEKVNTNWIVIVILVATAHFYTACKDEYSYEGTPMSDSTVTSIIDSSTQARFTFLGAPDTCIEPDVTGTYMSSSILTSANSVTLQVHVTTAGAYTFTTDTLDGFYFAASGHFNSTGDQTVSMFGTGTPVAPGIYHFKSIRTGTYCSFPIKVADAKTASYLLIADPSTRCVDQIIDGVYTSGVSLNASNHVTIVVDVKNIGVFTIRTNEINGMSFSYTGSFSNTGYQYVILTGTGTPESSGTYAFTPEIVGPHPLGGEACTFYVPVH